MLIAALSTEWWEKNKSASSEFSTLSSTLFLCFDDPFTIAGSHTSASLQHFFPTRFALLCRVLSRLKRKTFLFSFRDRTQRIIGSRSPWKWWNKLFFLSLSFIVTRKDEKWQQDQKLTRFSCLKRWPSRQRHALPFVQAQVPCYDSYCTYKKTRTVVQRWK